MNTLTTKMANTTASPLLGPGPTGLVGMLGYVILALVLLFNPKAFKGGKEARPEEKAHVGQAPKAG